MNSSGGMEGSQPKPQIYPTFVPTIVFRGLNIINRYRPKGVLEKGVDNNKNASNMRQKCAKMGLFLGEKGNVPKCVKNVSKMGNASNTSGGAFWTIPNKQGDPNLSKLCRKFENLSGNCRFFSLRQIFEQFGLGTPKSNRRDKLWTNLGFGPFF